MSSVMVAGMITVSAGLLFCHTARTPYVLLYSWTSAEVWYLLDRRAAVQLTVFNVVVSGVAIAIAGAGETDPLSWWLMGMGTSVVSMLAAMLRLRSDCLIGQCFKSLNDELAALRSPASGPRHRPSQDLRRRRCCLPTGRARCR